MRTFKLLSFLLLICGKATLAGPVAEAWHLPATTEAQIGIRLIFMKCMESELGQSVAGRKGCLGAENQFQDARLNRAYKDALARLAPPQRQLLQESQRGWLKMLPAHCQLEADYPNGGTDAAEADGFCHLHWRAYRAKYLESLQP